jgi:hypothetical protein
MKEPRSQGVKESGVRSQESGAPHGRRTEFAARRIWLVGQKISLLGKIAVSEQAKYESIILYTPKSLEVFASVSKKIGLLS